METQECLDNLTAALVAEGCSDEEIKSRVATLKHCIEFGEKMSAKLKEIKVKKESMRKESAIAFQLHELVEWALLIFLAGALGGSLFYQYMETR